MVGQIIKSLRESEGLTQAELAERIGININTLATYERETREPNIEKICLFADFFGVTTDYLLGKSSLRIPDIEVQSAAKLTGLSDMAVSILCALKKQPGNERIFEVLNLLIKHELPPPQQEDFHFVGTFGEPIEFNYRNYDMARDNWLETHAYVLSRLSQCLFYSPDPATEGLFEEFQKLVYEKGMGKNQYKLSSYRETLISAVIDAFKEFVNIEGGDIDGDGN